MIKSWYQFPSLIHTVIEQKLYCLYWQHACHKSRSSWLRYYTCAFILQVSATKSDISCNTHNFGLWMKTEVRHLISFCIFYLPFHLIHPPYHDKQRARLIEKQVLTNVQIQGTRPWGERGGAREGTNFGWGCAAGKN